MNTLNQNELAGIFGGIDPLTTPDNNPSIDPFLYEWLMEQLSKQHDEAMLAAWLEFMSTQEA